LASKEVKLRNVLDLTDYKVHNTLKIDPSILTSKTYELTNQIGDLAKKHGFDGIKVPSAVNLGGVNLVLLRKSWD